MLLFWPCIWGLTLVYDFSSSLNNYIFYSLLFLAGSILMRSAGCIVNDVLDRKFDNQVSRTKDRPIASEKISEGDNVGIIFGPERAGLENKEVIRSNALITVPVNPNFSSINLAQSVLLLSYEWFLAQHSQAENFSYEKKTEMASIMEIEKLSQQYETELDKIGFFFPDEKAISMKSSLRNIWSRLPLTVSDVRAFHGILRHLLKSRNL